MAKHQKPRIENKEYQLKFTPFLKDSTIKGVPIYYQSAGNQEVIKLEFVFNSGKIHQHIPGLANITASMLSEGTNKHTGTELLNALDFFGSYFQVRTGDYDSTASLFCLTKHFKSALPLFIEALTDSNFPTKALNSNKQNSIEKLKTSEKKSSFLCRKEFNKRYFGESHPLGKTASINSIEQIEQKEVQDFHKNFYLNGLKYILLSGKFDQSTLVSLSELTPFIKSQSSELAYLEITPEKGKFKTIRENAIQCSLKIGQTGINRKDPSFASFQLLNTILGGYFGSRLMKNIREDKGLTYGIYSYLDISEHHSIWSIESDVNKKNIQVATEEIIKELNKIISEPVPEAELEVAKNYYLGSILKSLDNNLSLSSRMKLIIDHGLNGNYLEDFVSQIISAKPEEILNTAKEFISIENLIEVTIE